MASLVEELMDVLEHENRKYKILIGLSQEKTPVIVAGKIKELQDIVDKERDISSDLHNLEKKRAQVMQDMAIVLSKEVNELTVSHLVDILAGKTQEQERLAQIAQDLKANLTQMNQVNQENQRLIQQAMEMISFDLTLYRSMRQAPTTANYGKDAYNTGVLLGSDGFDTKQ